MKKRYWVVRNETLIGMERDANVALNENLNMEPVGAPFIDPDKNWCQVIFYREPECM